MSTSEPPLDLSVNVTNAAGRTFRWGSEDKNPENIPRNLSFRTQLMQGFGDASATLRRRIDQDFVDINLLDDVAFVGADGATAYEGRVGATPRTYDTSHSLGVQFAGWMAHAKDRTFREIYIDRDFSKWQASSVTRQAAIVAGGNAPGSGEVVADDSGSMSIVQRFTGQWDGPTSRPFMESIYNANGIAIGSVYYAWTKGANVNSADANWFWGVVLGSDDVFTSTDASGNLRAAGPGSGTLTATTTTRTVAALQHAYTLTAVGTYGGVNTPYEIYWSPTVYGNHGLTLNGTSPGGYYASDVIADIASRFCPALNTSGISATSFTIPHLTYTDPTFPYDAFLDINKYHLWDLSVWDNKTLHYGPTSLDDYDWEVRLSDYGVGVSLQGDSTDGFANGIVVQFQDVLSGNATTLTPDDTTDLLDTSPSNPANIHGLKIWTTYQITVPTTPDAAIQFGRAALAEFNAPKAPGTITVSHHIKDRAGHWQQGWKVRAGDRVAITDHPNDRPRLVHETSWDHDAKTLTISVDAPARQLPAVIDRVQTALVAANLT